ncbi:element excision factor XisH family protein [Chroococcidiopsis sp. SAG 2025]
MAVREPIYKSFFKRRFVVAAIRRYQLRLIIYDVQQDVIVQWI